MVIDTVIKNGLIAIPQFCFKGSIGIDQGKIVSISKKTFTPKADLVIDAKHYFVMPGMIDMHVHFRDPGFPEREDFESGTRSAAAGGITTVADMPNTVPPVISVKALNEKKKIVEQKALIDYALVGGAGNISQDDLISLAKAGVAAFKTFLTARFEELAASDGKMLENFELISSTGRPCLIHAENEDIVSRWREKAESLGRIDPLAHSEFRPPIAEIEATMRTILLAKEAGVHLHICHVTSKEVIEIISWIKKRTNKVTGETTPNYLFLTANSMSKLGPFAKIDPPLRGKEDQKKLWKALRNGTLDVLASDHAPYSVKEKENGIENIFNAPSGTVSIETTLPLMLNQINQDNFGLKRLIEVFALNPAKILGLYPKKGVIQVGADADLVVVDMKREFIIKGEELHSKQKKTLFEGYKGIGLPIMTMVRGERVMIEGEIIGKPGYGEFQSR